MISPYNDVLFEFDPMKSRSNAVKHGIDFEEAQRLWQDPRRVEVRARTEGEARWITVGMLDDRHWSAIFTHRATRVRIISVRRARLEEVALYEG